MPRRDELQTRRIDLQIERVKERVEVFFADNGRMEVNLKPVGDGYEIHVRGNPSAQYMLSPFPRVQVSIGLRRQDQFTLISFDRDKTGEFIRWTVSKTILFIVPPMLFMLCFVVALQQWELDIPFVCYLAPELVLLVPLIATMIEYERVHNQLSALEENFWDSLEGGDGRLFAVQDAINRRKSQMVELLVSIILVTIPFTGLIFAAGFPLPALVFLISGISPLFLIFTLDLSSQRLPFRFGFGVTRALVSQSWFMAMFIPYALLLGFYRQWDLSSFDPALEEVIQVMIYQDGIMPLFALISLLLFFQSMVQTVGSYRKRYRSYLASPSGGMETTNPPRPHLFLYRLCGILFWAMLAVGTAAGVYHLTVIGFDPALRVQFWSYMYSQMTDLLSVSANRNNTQVAVVASATLLSILFAPLLITLGTWIKRIRRVIFGYQQKKGEQPEGADLLDSLTRSGFHGELTNALGGRGLHVRITSQRDHSPFGAALLSAGLIGASYTLLLDPVVFSIVRHPQQREALIWHEIGHARAESPLLSLVIELLFNVWGAQVKDLLFDSMEKELNADRYVTAQMGNATHLHKALESLNKVGWGSKPAQRDSFSTNLYALFKIMIGGEGMLYVHPHVEVRVASPDNPPNSRV